ncbi:MAG: hypothetical protein RLZZ337_1311 [Bacteroidota bacterium]|jgi:molybdenum cofactor biosynthesis protein MoaC
MIDITHKNNTKRVALASAIVKVGRETTIDAVLNKTVPKGDVLEMAKTAGLFAVKNTANSIPDCHPLPLEYTKVEYEISKEALSIKILITVATVYKTGVEVEAMHGASIIALTIYDMLKPIDKNIEIQHIKLEQKKGGKSDYRNMPSGLNAAVIVCSDTISAGKKEDSAGKAVAEKLQKLEVECKLYTIIPDDIETIKTLCLKSVEDKIDLILFVGGTGLSSRDNTPEAISPLLKRQLPGVVEHIRDYGMDRMPFAMLSRAVAGTIKNSIVITLPGSTRGATESMDAVFPSVLHAFHILRNKPHTD